MTAYKNMGFDIKDYPNAYERFINEITLPLHTKLTDEEVEYIIKKLLPDCKKLHIVNELPRLKKVGASCFNCYWVIHKCSTASYIISIDIILR